jgi:hypothetical protein
MSRSDHAVPARVQARIERRQSNAAGSHRTIKYQAKGGRSGARRAAIAEQLV